MTDRSALDFLSRHAELLAGLQPETSSAFAAACERRQLGHGDILFREGEPGQFMFVVERGALDVLKQGPDGSTAATASSIREFMAGRPLHHRVVPPPDARDREA